MKLSQLNLMTPTFLGVSSDTYKLGDVKLSGCATFGSTLQFLNPYGATATATAAMIGEEAAAAFPGHEAVFIYVTDAVGEVWGLPGGWYFREDWEDEGLFPINDVVIKSGQGFVVQAQDAGMTIQIPSAIH